MYAQEQTIFTQSKVLFAMSIDGASREAMAGEMESISKKPDDFYADCAKKLRSMEEDEFQDAMLQFQDSYAMCSLEFCVPELKSVEVPLDSRLMKITPSDHIGAPYVISICDPYQKGSKWTAVPLNTSRHSLHKIMSNKMAGTVMAPIRNGKLRIAWGYTRTLEQPKTSEASGVDTGITDAFYVSDGNHYGSMKPVLDFYYNEVEPAFTELSKLRNKKGKIKHYLHTHPDLDDDVRRSLIAKMDRLEHTMQAMHTPYRKLRHYNNLLEQAVSEAVSSYIDSLSPETLTVLERLDIKEFNKSRKANGEMSTFARGLLQKKLMAKLNWRGRDFLEVEPAYTSQVCPVCGNLDKANRNGKAFHCTCCGHEDDADHNASANIRARAMD